MTEGTTSPGRSRDALLAEALRRVESEEDTRNNTGFWLACQLRDNRHDHDQAHDALKEYLARVEFLGNGKYTEDEITNHLKQAYGAPAREPSGGNGVKPEPEGGDEFEAPPEPMPSHYEQYVTNCIEELWAFGTDGADLKYLLNRGLSPKTIREAEIGYDSEERRYQIPVRDRDRILWNIRRYSPSASAKYKMLNTPGYGSPTRLYGERFLVGRWALVVAGEWDCLLANQLGVPAVTSTNGESASFTPEMVEALRGLDLVAFLLDADPAGRESAPKRAAQLDGAEVVPSIKVADWGDYADRPGYDLTNFVMDGGHGKKELKKLLEETPIWFPGGAYEDGQFDLAGFMRNPPEVEIVAGGWAYRGQVHWWFGESGCGKTWVALWAMVREIRAGNYVAYFDEENGPVEIADRLITLGLTPEEVESRLLYYPESGGFDEDELKKLVRKYKPTLAVYDTAIAFLAIADKSENDSKEVKEWVDAGPKKLAGMKDAPAVVVLDHVTLTATSDTQNPRGSGVKLNTAQVGVFFHNRDNEKFERGDTTFLEVWKRKDRSGRLSLPAEVQLTSSRPDGASVVVADVDSEATSERRRTDMEAKLRKAFEQSGEEELPATPLAEALFGKSQARMKEHVRSVRAMAKGPNALLIERETGKKRPPYLYRLRETS